MFNGDYFKENPQYLKFKYTLTTKSSNADNLFNFEVFIGLKDRKEYIIYQNKYNNNLDIMDIYDKKIIISLKGHNNQINVLRYFIKDTNEDFLLSCDEIKWIIIWDIQNNYNIKYKLKSENYSVGFIIYDALLLFNIFNKDYILLSNDKINEYSELYEFTDNKPFIKNIDNTNNNMTKFLILWIYNNKYYIIECCWGKISINNIFENENYASLSLKNRGNHFSGFQYNDNYLCVGDYLYDNITMWDLVNKTIYKQIKYDAKRGYEIIPWNNKYTIIGCDGYFVIIDIEEGKMIKKINSNKVKILRGLKKIKMNNLGECLIGSGDGNIIELFSI